MHEGPTENCLGELGSLYKYYYYYYYLRKQVSTPHYLSSPNYFKTSLE